MKNIFGKFADFFRSPSYSRTIILLGVVLLAIVIPVTVVVLQQQTQTKQHASSNFCTSNNGVCIPLGECRANGWSCYNGKGCPGGTQCYFTSPTPTPIPPACGNSTLSILGHCYYGRCLSNMHQINDSGISCASQYGNSNYVCCAAGSPPPPPTPKCPTNALPGSFCTGSGSCRAEAGYHISATCGGGQVCCSPLNPTPTPPPLPKDNTCASSAGVHGTCYTNNSCGQNMHEIDTSGGKACAAGYRICCAQGTPTPWYDCENNNTFGSAIIKHTPTTSTVGTCANNVMCQDPSSGLVFINDGSNAIQQAKDALCKQAVDPNSCICDSNDPSHRAFSCNSNLGAIKRSCGNNMICYDKVKGAQDKVWPCIPDTIGPVPISRTNSIACGANGSGFCVYDGWLDRHGPNGLTTEQRNMCEMVCSDIPSCNTISNGTFHDIFSKGKECFVAPGNPYACCAPNISGGGTGGTNPTPTPGNGGNGGNSGGGGSAPTCTNGRDTQIALSLKLPGIGSGSFENNAPKHGNRTALYVTVTDQNGNAVYPKNQNIAFTYASGRFNSTKINLGTGLTCGNTYTVSVKLPTYLTATAQVTYGADQTLNLNPYVGDVSPVNVSNGTIIGNDKIDINDYEVVADCHNQDPTKPITFKSNASSVTVTCGDLINFFDYPDGGTQGDEWAANYNLWLRNFIAANGYKI